MQNLLHFLLKEITGNENFSIEEKEEDGALTLQVVAETEDMGIIIGKGGKTIKALQELLRVRGKIENKPVFINVIEKGSQ